MNHIKKEDYLKTQMNNLINIIEDNDFEDIEDMKKHIEKIHMNVILLNEIMEFVYKTSSPVGIYKIK